MRLKIQPGKLYRTATGRVFGPLVPNDHHRYVWKEDKEDEYFTWMYDGKFSVSYDSLNMDLVEEVLEESDTTTQQGAKYDAGKLRFSLLTRGLAAPLRMVAAVLTYGAGKYAANSWQHVPNAKERYEDALDRHLNAWKDGEMCDPESHLPHLAHVATNALFLLWFYK